MQGEKTIRGLSGFEEKGNEGKVWQFDYKFSAFVCVLRKRFFAGQNRWKKLVLTFSSSKYIDIVIKNILNGYI